MKAYNKYMDKITVSGVLHQKLVSCMNNSRPKLNLVKTRHYAEALACFVVVLLGLFTFSKLLPHNGITGNVPSVLQPGTTLPIPGVSAKYTLEFNRADGQLANKINIPGHFWQELTANEIKAVFPTLGDTHTIKATAHFQSDENGATLFNVDASVKSVSGFETYMQIAPGEIVLDYAFDIETKSTNVHGTKVTAGYFEAIPNSNGIREIIYFASFKLADAAYYVELGGLEAEKEVLKSEISELIGLLIEGGTADLDVFQPVVPELREERLDLDGARADIDFGAYLPAALPRGFVFKDALRFINQEQNALYVNWSKGMGYINWRVSFSDDNAKARITSIADIKNYDLALYPIPRADSVPDELSEIVDNPIFLIDELTLEAVRARTYEVSEWGDIPGPRMRFSVLYGDILVELSVKGASAEAMFDILHQLKNRN